jgi:hypothetical protein
MKKNKISVTQLFLENLTIDGTVNNDCISHRTIVRVKTKNIREDLTTIVVRWAQRTHDRRVSENCLEPEKYKEIKSMKNLKKEQIKINKKNSSNLSEFKRVFQNTSL